jgi:hypothetical protein
MVPALLLYAAENADPPLAGRIIVALAGVVGVLALPSALRQFDLVQKALLAMETRVKEDIVTIEAWPLGPNETRAWEYRIPGRGFGVGFVVNYAASPTVSDWYQRADLRDRYVQLTPRKPWRYAVLSKGSYPTVEAVSKWWGFKPGDRIQLLSETAVVEHPSKDTP